jgi:hypothetical protein
MRSEGGRREVATGRTRRRKLMKRKVKKNKKREFTFSRR